MRTYVDFSYSQLNKSGENISGDVMLCKRLEDQDRLIGVLSDGLGSGIKANILSTMTSTMAMRFMEDNRNIMDFVDTIISALPICKIRKLSYATFSLLEIFHGRQVRVAEMGNPKFIMIKNGKSASITSKTLSSDKWQKREISLYDFDAALGDRIIVVSDGVSQPGLTSFFNYREYIESVLKENSEIDSFTLARKVVNRARYYDNYGKIEDDMTCAVFHFRKPENLMIVTGPPYYISDDSFFASKVKEYPGSKIICGGVTAKIIARELNLDLSIDLSTTSNVFPPVYNMNEFAMVTEGIVTLTELTSVLKNDKELKRNHPVMLFADKLKKVDVIDFLVGTKINEAHMAPNFPLALNLRRNIVKELAEVLRKKFLKEVNINYI